MRLRELSVLPPFKKANGKVLLSSNNLLFKMKEKSTDINTQEHYFNIILNCYTEY